jgi:hypothetical protein
LQEQALLQQERDRAAVQTEALAVLDEDSRQLRLDSQRLKSEVQFHRNVAETLQAQNDALRERVRRLQMDAELAAQKDEEFAKRGVKQGQIIKDLQEKLKVTVRNLDQCQRDLDAERSLSAGKERDLVSGAQLEATRLRNALETCQRDLKRVRGLAKTIVEQRSEAERFVLESLESVKAEVLRRRQEELALAKTEFQKQRLRRGIRSVDMPEAAVAPVGLSDFSLADRERALTRLLGKLNRQPAAEPLPQHTFFPAGLPQSASAERLPRRLAAAPAGASALVPPLMIGAAPPQEAGDDVFLTGLTE